jgi:hypothetical protein
MRRLGAPEWLAIDRCGRTVTLASSHAPQFTFEADGRRRTELTNNNRQISVQASLYGEQLVVSTIGDRGNDYSVTFDLMDGGSDCASRAASTSSASRGP